MKGEKGLTSFGNLPEINGTLITCHHLPPRYQVGPEQHVLVVDLAPIARGSVVSSMAHEATLVPFSFVAHNIVTTASIQPTLIGQLVTMVYPMARLIGSPPW